MERTSIITKAIRKNSSIVPLLLLIFLALIWGSSFILMKKGLEVYSPTQTGSLRVAFSFLVMLPFALFSLHKIPKDKWKYITIMGFLGNLIPAFLFGFAVLYLKSSVAGILNALTPLFALLIGIIGFGVKMKKHQLLGLLLGFFGCAGLSFINADGGVGGLNVFVLLVVSATICYATSSNIIKTHLSDIPAIQLTAMAMLVIGPISIIYLFSTDFVDRLMLPEAYLALSYLFILGTIGTAFGLVLFNIIIQKTSAVFATSVTYIVPIVAIMWGVLDGEQLFALHFVGMGFIVAGVYLINRSRKKN